MIETMVLINNTIRSEDKTKQKYRPFPLHRQQAAAEEAGERTGPVASFADSVMSDGMDGVDDYNDEAAGDVVFRRRMGATAKVRRQHATLGSAG